LAVVTSVSQPSAGLFVQCAQPDWQVIWQLPCMHDTVWVFADPQTLLQPPQWLTLVVVFVSQPSAGLFVQCWKPFRQPN
jgi:hypothetical protein